MTSNQPTYIDDRYPLSALTSRIIAAAKEVHRVLGPGFREVIYQRALELEFPTHDLDCSREVWINIHFRGHAIGKTRVDFIIGDDRDSVMLEVKAKGSLEDCDIIQAVSYLKASGHKIGLLINFGAKQLEIRRLAN